MARIRLNGISAYASNGSPPHWHFVAYGLSDLYAKRDPDRPQRLGDRAHPPAPAAGRRVRASDVGRELHLEPSRAIAQSGNVLFPGHRIDGGGPIAVESSRELVVGAFSLDPQLGEIDTLSGHVRSSRGSV